MVQTKQRSEHWISGSSDEAIFLGLGILLGHTYKVLGPTHACKCELIHVSFSLIFVAISGRAIRHINDYAAILLVDSRYAFDHSKRSSSHPTNKLPKWIKDCLRFTPRDYGELHGRLHEFFEFNKKCR